MASERTNPKLKAKNPSRQNDCPDEYEETIIIRRKGRRHGLPHTPLLQSLEQPQPQPRQLLPALLAWLPLLGRLGQTGKD